MTQGNIHEALPQPLCKSVFTPFPLQEVGTSAPNPWSAGVVSHVGHFHGRARNPEVEIINIPAPIKVVRVALKDLRASSGETVHLTGLTSVSSHLLSTHHLLLSSSPRTGLQPSALTEEDALPGITGFTAR
ncbi:unnamed protein product [Pleuronectes platessa]|uniref:Uncharacterized protein n=1 Tax=Pleuronectes platessa TaxID=8262 RepID=A0A9N7U5G4_PLEPL|nr:unnamed protein product [Pleuronectes platessa]